MQSRTQTQPCWSTCAYYPNADTPPGTEISGSRFHSIPGGIGSNRPDRLCERGADRRESRRGAACPALRHSHGGSGLDADQRPLWCSLASVSSACRSASLRSYCWYHQALPLRTSSFIQRAVHRAARCQPLCARSGQCHADNLDGAVLRRSLVNHVPAARRPACFPGSRCQTAGP